MMDTGTLTEQKPDTEGTWEVQHSSYEGEADLHKQFNDCQKNPGHMGYIPILEFTVDKLPPRYRDSDMLNCVKAVAKLTVRVSVTCASKMRPEPFSGSLYGTGWVVKVFKFPNRFNKTFNTCTCYNCNKSSSPETQFAHIIIQTAAHIVYDAFEGPYTKCFLFYDKEDYMPKAVNGVVVLSGMSHVYSNLEGDTCKMVHVTHDVDLINKLDKMVHRLEGIQKSLQYKYFNFFNSDESLVPVQSATEPNVQRGSDESLVPVQSATEPNVQRGSDECLVPVQSATEPNIQRGSDESLVTVQSATESNFQRGSDESLVPVQSATEPNFQRGSVIIVSHPHGRFKHVSVGEYTSLDSVGSGFTKYKYNTATCPGSSGAYLLIVERFLRLWNGHIHSGSEFDGFNYSNHGIG